jgi:hypothetical protein
MRLDLLRSKEQLDKSANSSKFSTTSAVRGAENSADVIHIHFEFDDYRGDTPHARVSLTWTDVEAAIISFAAKGHPSALRIQQAERLAAAVKDISKTSN